MKCYLHCFIQDVHTSKVHRVNLPLMKQTFTAYRYSSGNCCFPEDQVDHKHQLIITGLFSALPLHYALINTLQDGAYNVC